jgi:hypothetical protein
MKKWNAIGIFAVLVIGMVLMSGCTNTGSTNATPVVTPTSQIVTVTVLVTPSPTPAVTRAQDPVIGVWRYYNSSDGYDDRYRFNADGTYVESFYFTDKQETRVYYGTWSALGSNSYAVVKSTKEYQTYLYDPTVNGIYPDRYPHLTLTPYQGDVAVASPYK